MYTQVHAARNGYVTAVVSSRFSLEYTRENNPISQPTTNRHANLFANLSSHGLFSRMPQEPLVRVISIGALSAHPLWGERGNVRTGHSTTTLITMGKNKILVDPGLPPTVLAARLAERANLSPTDITHVFLTSFHPDTRRALHAFESAAWIISEAEREAVGVALATRLREVIERGAESSIGRDVDLEGEHEAQLEIDDNPELHANRAQGEQDLDDPVAAYSRERAILEREISLLRRCVAAPDEIVPKVDLFPLPGVTPGLSGLLIEGSRFTTLICGDAVPTAEHLERGQVLTIATDVEQARESFREAVEIADVMVLGRDNIIMNALKGPF